jgi:8-oxo-dGTP diphosphatase
MGMTKMLSEYPGRLMHGRKLVTKITKFLDYVESWIRYLVIFVTNFLPVKVIKDEHGRPFLYRYHLFTLGNDGPGMCIHHFVASDPDRGYHDHPWAKALSFILCGGYTERILDGNKDERGEPTYNTFERKRWRFNYLKGNNVFHRVMLGEGEDAWTLFAFQKRSKTWGMVDLRGVYNPMSTTVMDQDGGWWNHVMKGLGVHSHLKHDGNVTSCVDIIVIADSKVLLIKRGKNPCRNMWAFPGGRIEQKDADILTAARRELKEETQLDNIDLEYVTTIGNNRRDPRGFYLSVIFMAKLPMIPTGIRAGDDAIDYDWFDLNNLPEMAFDHRQILDNIDLI